jgi:hypothetical protein
MSVKLFDGFFAEYFAKPDASVDDLPEYSKNIWGVLTRWYTEVVECKEWKPINLTSDQVYYTSCKWLIGISGYENDFRVILFMCGIFKYVNLLEFIEENILLTDSNKKIIARGFLHGCDLETSQKYSLSPNKRGGFAEESIKIAIINDDEKMLRYLIEEKLDTEDYFKARGNILLASMSKSIDIIDIIFVKYNTHVCDYIDSIYHNMRKNFESKTLDILKKYIENDVYYKTILPSILLSDEPNSLNELHDFISFTNSNNIAINYKDVFMKSHKIYVRSNSNDEFNLYAKLNLLFETGKINDAGQLLIEAIVSFNINDSLVNFCINRFDFNMNLFVENKKWIERIDVKCFKLLVNKGYTIDQDLSIYECNCGIYLECVNSEQSAIRLFEPSFNLHNKDIDEHLPKLKTIYAKYKIPDILVYLLYSSVLRSCNYATIKWLNSLIASKRNV